MSWRRFFLVETPDRWRAVLRALAAVNPELVAYPVELTVEEAAPHLSPAQRAYFHVVCDEVGAALGYTGGEFKDVVKCAFFGEGWASRSTEDLDAEAYGRLIEVALYLGAWAGVTAGSPGEPGRAAPAGGSTGHELTRPFPDPTSTP